MAEQLDQEQQDSFQPSFHGHCFELLYRSLLALHVTSAALLPMQAAACPGPAADSPTHPTPADASKSAGPTGEALQDRVAAVVGNLERHRLHFLLEPLVAAVKEGWGIASKEAEGRQISSQYQPRRNPVSGNQGERATPVSRDEGESASSPRGESPHAGFHVEDCGSGGARGCGAAVHGFPLSFLLDSIMPAAPSQCIL